MIKNCIAIALLLVATAARADWDQTYNADDSTTTTISDDDSVESVTTW